MKVVKWSPMYPNRVFRDFDDMFEDFAGPMAEKGFAPAVDIYEEDNLVVVEAPLAGVDIDNVEISIENDILTIEGSSEKKTEIDEKDYYRKEVRYGSFRRSIALPTAVNGDEADANYKDGVLKIQIPKNTGSVKKTIEIKK